MLHTDGDQGQHGVQACNDTGIGLKNVSFSRGWNSPDKNITVYII
jgi:hypothetical protein